MGKLSPEAVARVAAALRAIQRRQALEAECDQFVPAADATRHPSSAAGRPAGAAA